MPTTKADKFDFLMGFVSVSKDYKSQFIDKWREVLSNFIVEPHEFAGNSSVGRPYDTPRRAARHGYSLDHRNSPGGSIILKDGETHKAVMTYAAGMTLSVIGDPRGEFVQASPVGYEDAESKAPTTTALLRYCFGLPGHFRTFVEAFVDMILMGTAIVESPWRFQQREMPVREIEFIEGVGEVDTSTRQLVTSYDDPALRVVSNEDFFPDPSESRIQDMPGVAKKFRMTGLQARMMAQRGIYTKDGVEDAINHAMKMHKDGRGKSETRDYDDHFREGIDSPYRREQMGDFVPMIGYEYWGDLPWEDDEGSSRGVVTALAGQLVRPGGSIPYPLSDPELPFHEFVINPVKGRFYGVSPAEVIRYSQDLQDAMMRLLTMAVMRRVMPPVVIDSDADLDVAAIRNWSPDMPIVARGGPNAAGTLNYGADVFSGFNHVALGKQQMQEQSGAVASVQGQPVGGRASATEAQFTQRQAVGRPELAAALVERESMPSVARGVLRRYQQFLDDSEALADRVGEQPNPAWIGDIMGDFDVKFTGSRQAMSRQEKLQAYDRLAGLTAAIPAAQAQVPWNEILQHLIGQVLELPEVAAKVGNENDMLINLLLQAMQGQGQGAGNGNSTVPGAEPAGAILAQVSGGAG